MTKRQEGREDSPLTAIEEGRGYRPQNKIQKKEKSNLGGIKLKIYPLRSRFPSKTESLFCHHQMD